jgi:hypothetical protein
MFVLFWFLRAELESRCLLYHFSRSLYSPGPALQSLVRKGVHGYARISRWHPRCFTIWIVQVRVRVVMRALVGFIRHWWESRCLSFYFTVPVYPVLAGLARLF